MNQPPLHRLIRSTHTVDREELEQLPTAVSLPCEGGYSLSMHSLKHLRVHHVNRSRTVRDMTNTAPDFGISSSTEPRSHPHDIARDYVRNILGHHNESFYFRKNLHGTPGGGHRRRPRLYSSSRPRYRSRGRRCHSGHLVRQVIRDGDSVSTTRSFFVFI